MRDGVKLAFAWQYDTRDQTDNLSVDEALVRIDTLLGDMRTALLETRELTAELGFSKRGFLAAGRGGAHATAQGWKRADGNPCRGRCLLARP